MRITSINVYGSAVTVTRGDRVGIKHVRTYQATSASVSRVLFVASKIAKFQSINTFFREM